MELQRSVEELTRPMYAGITGAAVHTSQTRRLADSQTCRLADWYVVHLLSSIATESSNPMYVVRNVFQAKPGKAGALVTMFKAANKLLDETRIWGVRLLTDTVSTYWTVVLEFEVAELADYFDAMEERSSDPRWKEAMSGYMDLVEGGHREIFNVETAWTKSELTVGG